MLCLIFLSFLFFFSCSGDHRDLHSFPTRRFPICLADPGGRPLAPQVLPEPVDLRRDPLQEHPSVFGLGERSEEHTSELQSQFHLVCRLLLEKKKHSHKQRPHSRTPRRYSTDPSTT